MVYEDGVPTFCFKWFSESTLDSLGSGLDDYPREDREYKPRFELDIHVWEIFFCETLLDISVDYDTKES